MDKTLISKNITYLIDEARKRGVNQSNLAKELKMSRQLLSMYKNNSNPCSERIEDIANYFGLTKNQLINIDISKLHKQEEINKKLQTLSEELTEDEDEKEVLRMIEKLLMYQLNFRVEEIKIIRTIIKKMNDNKISTSALEKIECLI